MRRLIFGCGYLGLRVAMCWLADGDTVFAVTRSDDRASQFRELGIEPVIADVTDAASLDSLPPTDTVLFAVGMDRSRYSDIRDVYVQGLQRVIDRLPDTGQHVIYVSSTGVYGDFGGDWVDEDSPTDPQREGGKACLAAERLLLSSRFAARATVLRFAGIYGPDRVPTRQQVLQKHWDKLSPQGYLNLIHVDDGARVVREVANTPADGQTYLVSDGQPSLRRDYYDFIAERLSVGPIPWEPNAVAPAESRASSSKRIGNKKLMEHFDITLDFPDYRAGLAQAMAARP